MLNEAGEQLWSERISSSRDNWEALAKQLRASDCVAMEATTNSNAVARLLRHSGARVIISNPLKTRVIAQAKVKTDKVDARVLAELARADYLPTVWLPDADTEALRELMSDRRSVVARRTELKNRLQAILASNLIADNHTDLFGVRGRAYLARLCAGKEAGLTPLDRVRVQATLAELDGLAVSIKAVEGIIAAMVMERPHWRANLDRLLTIPGVSLVVGAGLLAAIGDISRFPAAKHLASYFGLVPSTYQSGDSQARHGRITKQGRAEARWLAIEAAEHLRRGPGPLRLLYQRVCAKRGHNVAVVAVARKLAELVWHLLSKQEDYLYHQPRLTMEKRAKVRLTARLATNTKTASATPRKAGRAPLYGSALPGRQVLTQIARQAALRAEQIYQAVLASKSCPDTTSPQGFNPLKPNPVDWQKLLEIVA
ncbi:MAG: IS110 family transposase, partial [Thermodesulfobacteriota bacterium]